MKYPTSNRSFLYLMFNPLSISIPLFRLTCKATISLHETNFYIAIQYQVFLFFNQCNFQYFNFSYAKETGENVIRRFIGFPSDRYLLQVDY